MSCQSRFDARYWMLGAGALGRPRGTHVYQVFKKKPRICCEFFSHSKYKFTCYPIFYYKFVFF